MAKTTESKIEVDLGRLAKMDIRRLQTLHRELICGEGSGGMCRLEGTADCQSPHACARWRLPAKPSCVSG